MVKLATHLFDEDECDDCIADVESEPHDLFGMSLVNRGDISQDQLHIALHEQKKTNALLGETLVRLGFLDEEILAVAVAERAGITSIDLTQIEIQTVLFKQFSKASALRCYAVPLWQSAHELHIAMADPFDIMALDEIRQSFPRGLHITSHVASRTQIQDLLVTIDDSCFSIDDILQEIENKSENATVQDYEHPVIRLVNVLLHDAVRRGASDIHFEPEDSFARIRFRIDGTLRQIRALHLSHWPALSQRLKIMAGMNIADARSIQDGRFQLQMAGRDIDFRVAIMPTVWGETIVLRILDHRKSLLPLSALGYSSKAEDGIQRIMMKPQGITLITGPTGSGKTTTLYSLLQQLSTEDVHIATLEEPVEFQLSLIRQTSVQESQGLDFAAGVRGLLRMDPDIILIGEIRDADTAQMALRAAMTGHQVYATIHCNDVFGALPRLIDLGLSPRVLAGNISGLIGQRLVRKLCPHCKTKRRASLHEAALLCCDQENPPYIAEAKGCPLCDQTGRKGRTVIAEVLPITSALDDLIAADAPRSQLTAQAAQDGFISLQDDGIARVLNGEVSLADLCRAADMSRHTPLTKAG